MFKYSAFGSPSNACKIIFNLAAVVILDAALEERAYTDGMSTHLSAILHPKRADREHVSPALREVGKMRVGEPTMFWITATNPIQEISPSPWNRSRCEIHIEKRTTSPSWIATAKISL
jgi:hypothetical protein